jgi:hypothetical protein
MLIGNVWSEVIVCGLRGCAELFACEYRLDRLPKCCLLWLIDDIGRLVGRVCEYLCSKCWLSLKVDLRLLLPLLLLLLLLLLVLLRLT